MTATGALAVLRDGWLRSLAVLGLSLFAVYMYSAPPDVTFEDTSEFAGACATLGLPHPPGFPLFVLSCFPVTRLAMFAGLTPALGATIATALAAAGACVLLAMVLARVVGSRAAALLGAGLLGLAPSYWDQAQIPEVYALNVALLMLAWYLCQRLVEGGGQRWLQGLALCAGLGLANHWPLFALCFPALLLWLGPAWPRIFGWLRGVRLWLACAGWFALGLLPYAHLLLLGTDAYLFDPRYGNGVQDLIAFVRRDYFAADGEVLTIGQRLAAALATTVWFVREYQYVFGLAAVYGLGLLAWRRRWWQLAAVAWALLVPTLLLALLRPYDPSVDSSYWIQHTYPLPSYAFAALPLAMCVAWLLGRWWRWPRTSPLLVVGAILLAVLAWWLPTADRRGDLLASWHNRLLLEALPDNALLINDPSEYGVPLRYVERFSVSRPDVAIVNENDYFQDWVAFDRETSARDERRMAAEQRPVAFVSFRDLQGHGSRFHGTHYTLDKSLPAGTVKVELTPAVREYVAYLHELRTRGVPRNVVTADFLRAEIVEAVGRLEAVRLRGGALDYEDAALLQLLAQTPEGQFAKFVTRVTDAPRASTLAQVEQAAIDLNAHWDGLSRQMRAEVFHILARAHDLLGNRGAARSFLQQSLQEYPTNWNAWVIIDLLKIHSADGDFEAYLALRGEYPWLDLGRHLAAHDERCAARLGRPCKPVFIE